MSEDLIVSVSGIRGVVGPALGPLEALRFCAALADALPPGPVVVGTDGRPSGAWLSQAAQAGLRSRGRDVIDIGVAATPVAGGAVRQLGAAGGIHVTASHNPAPYNGLKLFGGDGRAEFRARGRRLDGLGGVARGQIGHDVVTPKGLKRVLKIDLCKSEMMSNLRTLRFNYEKWLRNDFSGVILAVGVIIVDS